MSKSKKKKETKAVIAGQIAFWVSFLGIISLPIPAAWLIWPVPASLSLMFVSLHPIIKTNWTC